MNKRDYDVTIIGAGMAGLTCAAKLQKKGKRVLLVEQHNKAGGYCTNFKRKGYDFETSIHFIVGCEPGGMLYDILTECGAERNVKFIKLAPAIYKSVYPDRTFVIPASLSEFKKKLSQEFPHESVNVEKYFSGLERMFAFIEKMNNKNISPLRKAAAPVLDFRTFWTFIFNLNKTFDKYLYRDIRDQRVREIVSQLWGFFGVPPKRLSYLFYVMGFTGYFMQGAYYIEGGSQRLSDGIAKAFTENGGILLLNADAKEILIENGTAKGIRVYDKRSKQEKIYTSDIVVSCADATHTYSDLVGEKNLPAGFLSRIRSLKPAISAFAVYLGVKMDLPEEFKDDFDVFVYSSYDSEAAFDSVIRREGMPAYALSFYSNVWPGFSPEPGKKHVISLLTIMNLEESRMKELWKIDDIYKRGEKYKKIKERYAAELLDRAEKIIPGLKKSIEVMEIATPVTMKRYTRNLNGSILGWENSVSQSLLKRMKQTTPVKNLFMASAWTFPGGGVNGATMGGSIAADRVLRRLRK